MSLENAASWGLPEGFEPVRFAIADEVKVELRPLMQPDEPAVVTLANIEGTVTLVGTTGRVFVVRSGEAQGGASGFSSREFPWQAITKLTLSHAGQNVKISIGFRTSNGRTPEVGRRAALGRDAMENAMPFESQSGQQAFAALYQIWQHARQTPIE